VKLTASHVFVNAAEMKIKKLMPMDAKSRRLIDWMEKGEIILRPLNGFNVFTYFFCILKNSVFYFYLFWTYMVCNTHIRLLFSELAHEQIADESSTYMCSSSTTNVVCVRVWEYLFDQPFGFNFLGVYDALQKKYLKTLLFCICEKEEGPMIEEYACKFFLEYSVQPVAT
jgi:hypothetical protein